MSDNTFLEEGGYDPWTSIYKLDKKSKSCIEGTIAGAGPLKDALTTSGFTLGQCWNAG